MTKQGRLDSATDAATLHMSTTSWVKYPDCMHDIMLTVISVGDMDAPFITLIVVLTLRWPCRTVNTRVDRRRKELLF